MRREREETRDIWQGRDALTVLPEEIWHAILLHCGINWALRWVSGRWAALASHNGEQLLQEWLQREASAPHPLPGRKLCASIRGMQPSWALYRAVMRCDNMRRDRMRRAVARDESVTLRDTKMVLYDDESMSWRILSLPHYAYWITRRNPMDRASITEETPHSQIELRCARKGAAPLTGWRLAFTGQVAEGNGRHALWSAPQFERKHAAGELALLYTTPAWTMGDILDYLRQSVTAKEREDQVDEALMRVRTHYEEQARARWMGERVRESEALRADGAAEWVCLLTAVGVHAVCGRTSLDRRCTVIFGCIDAGARRSVFGSRILWMMIGGTHRIVLPQGRTVFDTDAVTHLLKLAAPVMESAPELLDLMAVVFYAHGDDVCAARLAEQLVAVLMSDSQ